MHVNNRWLILAMISSALFLIIIDMTVLYTALPRLTLALDASASQKLWIVNAYPLVVAGLLPGAGMLSDRIGHKRLFIAGLPVFAVASLCAAFSPSAEWLIAARVFLAVGAAMMMPATLSIVRHVFTDERERALAIGIWAAVASGGAAIGPVVGGVLLEYFWWGSVFLINVPVVLAVLPFAWRLIPHCGGENKSPYDIIGSVQIMAGLVGCIYALKELSKAAPSFTALAIAAAIGVVSLWLFVRRQRRARYPMIDFSLFQNRLFAGGVGVALVSMIALVGVELVLTQRLQLVLELSPLQAALFILPIPLASALAGPLTGLLLPRFGERSMILGGFILTGLGIAGLALLYQSSLVLQLICLFIAGFGLGGVITAASTAIMLNAPEEKSGMAASIEDVSYELGGVLGITLLGGLMTAIYSHSLALPDSLPVSDIAYDSIDEALRLAANLAADQAEQLKQLARLAFDRAFIVVLIAAATLMALGAGVAKMALRK
ncbi:MULTISPECIES: MFS transporter [Serratia]|jgi:DHA2 family multidrug resistance protein-like MFS transporter|uniref:MFS transporter n=1 Tax=Serratia liquefaciens TaxID=614 RepID=A0A515CUI4_SERLI|nr:MULTISPECIES: MFS transporter [Serratia]AYO38384.1 MFS transporter [Serratia sp. P2ACOL2]MBI6161878.1 MFS transporter [Serratia liquefaciens]MBV0842239.1 MFS transporter [Serratia liquefaciens]MCS4317181.1 DHA2 family multidrug resistance protein-like MFS transporter [Serratia sp. BIGb0234]MDU5485783.1 MFS transporter [Serratia liquefaciens]